MIRNCLEKEFFCMYGTFYLVNKHRPGHLCTYIMDLLSVFTYCIQYLALFLFIMTTQFQAIASFYYPSKFLTRLCDRAQTKTGNIQIFINMVLLITNTQNNKLCLRQLDTSSAIESATLLLQKYGTSASQIRASNEIMLQDQGRSNFKTFFSIY